jgi:hypothetical protein
MGWRAHQWELWQTYIPTMQLLEPGKEAETRLRRNSRSEAEIPASQQNIPCSPEEIPCSIQ